MSQFSHQRLTEIAEAQTFRCNILKGYLAILTKQGQVAETQPLDTGHLFYAGPQAFFNEGVGIGLSQGDHEQDEDETVAEIIKFYEARGVVPKVEASISARPSFLKALQQHRFVADNPSNVMSMMLDDWALGKHTGHSGYSVEQASRLIYTSDYVLSMIISGYGLEDNAVNQAFYRNWLSTEGQTVFMVFDQQSEPIGLGSCLDINGISYLSGASVLPSARNQGIHQALLHQRIDHLAAIGSRKVIFVATPASVSESNALKVGFKIIDTRFKHTCALGTK